MTEGITGITGETGDLTLTDITNEIRTQLNMQMSHLPSETVNATTVIRNNNSILDTKTITQNGLYQAFKEGLDGYSSVEVNVDFRYIEPDNFAF